MKKKKRPHIWRATLFVFVSFVLGLTVYGWNAKNLTGNAMPMPLGFGVGVVRSGSMEPELSVDDLIFVVKSGEYEVGDTVVFQRRATLVVHKIVAIEENVVTTKGTANNVTDEPIEIASIKGKVAFRIGGIGAVVNVLSSPIGTLSTLALAAWLLVRSYKGERKEDEEKEEIRKEIERLKGEKRE